MMPTLQKGNLSGMPPAQRKRICKHEPECEHFFVMMFAGKDIMMCEGETRDFGESIISQANQGLVKGKRVNRKTNGWTAEEEEVIKSIIEKSPTGASRKIADCLGRDMSVVYSKIKRMREVGKL